jgi:hypothetical protein
MTSLVKDRRASRRLARSFAIVALARELSDGVEELLAAGLTVRPGLSQVFGALDPQLSDSEARGRRLQPE